MTLQIPQGGPCFVDIEDAMPGFYSERFAQDLDDCLEIDAN